MTRQDIQQREVANYTYVKTTHTTKRCGQLYGRQGKTYNKEKWLIIRTSRQHMQQRDVTNCTDDNAFNKEM